MRLLRSFPALAFALVLLSIAGLCAAQRSVGLLLVAGTLAAISWSVTEGPRGRTLPRWVSNILVIGVCLNVFRDLMQNSADVMGVLGRFTLLLTLVKLYERRHARDYAQLLMLSLVLMITGCMQSSDLIFGVVLLLYVVLGLYVLLLYQMHAAYEQARDSRNASIPADYRLAPPLKPIIGRHLGLHFRLASVAIGLMGVLLSVGVFVGFPRGFGADLLGTLNAPGAGREAGFSWEVNLATGGRINASAARVFTVQFTEDDRPIRMSEPVYLRGAVLDRYEGGGRWTSPEARTRRYRMTSGRSERVTPSGIESGRTIAQHVTFTRAVGGEMPLFSIYAPTGMAMDTTVDVLYDPRRQALRTTKDTRRVVGYTVRAQPEPSLGTQRAITDQIIPAGGPDWFVDREGRVEGLARQLLAEAGLPDRTPSFDRDDRFSNAWDWNRRATEVFENYLQNSDFKYTLDLSDVRFGSDDPIVNFLFEDRRGNCEYFASALAALCQSVAIPSRVVVGFLAQQYDESTQQYVVMEGNAHAWVEIAVAPHMWKAYDGTPAADLPSLTEDDGTLAQAVRSMYSRFEGNWSTQVVGFDTGAQERLIDSFSQGWSRRLSSLLTSIRGGMESVNNFFNVGPGGYIWMGIVALALVIAIIALARLMRRSMAIRRTLHLQHLRGSEYRRMLAQLGFYLDMLRVLERGGLAKPEWRPPMLHAAAITVAAPEPARLVRDITVVFYEARYGLEPIEGRRLDQARGDVRRLADLLRTPI